ncbi:AAA family ATPase [Aeromicrobium sp. 179-A 4D2 NHS]|uniref:AAA family ATPase n=1 Tax=Aeromicrobium sp. 179-A 4D2 NHS TaxID=3142375 RepID=UPI00399FB7ED
MTALFIIGGHAGTGKTTYGHRLAIKTGAVLLDKDTLSLPFVNVLCEQLTGDPDDRHTDTYRELVRPLEYQTLMAAAWTNLTVSSAGVIVVAPFIEELNDPTWVAGLQAQCDARRIGLAKVWMHCPEDVLRDRLIRRGAKRDHHKIANWNRWYSDADPSTAPEGCIALNSAPRKKPAPVFIP